MPIARSTFATDEGIEVPAITTMQMRELDRVAIKQTGLELRRALIRRGSPCTLVR